MEKARTRNFTKRISAIVTPEDYEFLKEFSESNDVSLGDFLRDIIHAKRIEVSAKKTKKRTKQTA